MNNVRDEEFTRLYAEHAQSLYSFLSYRTGDRVFAEDLLAETFEQVLRTRRTHDGRKASERLWVYRIALSCVRNAAERSPSPSGGTGPFLGEALATLNDDEREAVALRFGAGLSPGDIATLLDVPRGTVETRIYRGLKKLRGCLTVDARPGQLRTA